jgi:ubiquinone/menaquinone biosynthesis C-methylase UbiE
MTGHTHYLPAMGKHWLLFLYDPFTRLLGAPRVHSELLDRAAIESGHRVLEIGCGTGNLLAALRKRGPRVDAVGIDPDPAALRRARRKAAGVRFEQAFAGELPLADASVDRVLSAFMLHHLDAGEGARAMLEVRRVLRPGGELHAVDLAANDPGKVLGLMRDAGLTGPVENGRGHRAGPLGDYVFYRASR